MKRLFISISLCLLVLCFTQCRKQRTEASPEEGRGSAFAPPSEVIIDPVGVFKKAFWRRPAPDDEILNAERREWKDGSKMTRWQWFLEIRPSSELTVYLRDQNSFSLREIEAPSHYDNQPVWFKSDIVDTTILSASGGDMELVFKNDGTRLYATGFGGGFRAGAKVEKLKRN